MMPLAGAAFIECSRWPLVSLASANGGERKNMI